MSERLFLREPRSGCSSCALLLLDIILVAFILTHLTLIWQILYHISQWAAGHG